MTLLGVILRKVASLESVGSSRRYPSPPPEEEKLPSRRRTYVNKFAHIQPKVDTSPLPLDSSHLRYSLVDAKTKTFALYRENLKLLMAIKRIYLTGGKVDSRWRKEPPPSLQYYYKRINFLKRIERDNRRMHKLITTAQPKVDTTKEHQKNWARARRDIVSRAQREFILFPPSEVELLEDPAFTPASGVKRPRVWLHLGTEGGCRLGAIQVELFTDTCPRSCALFLELLKGDTGFGYIGTRFFRKVPHLYWSGGDVVHDDGRGCYAQRGRTTPIPAENYHFSHSMPGLLSMRVTPDDEVCGIFNITFKRLPQFDLKNVVFGRVIRPNLTYAAMERLGSALSPRPVVRLMSPWRNANS